MNSVSRHTNGGADLAGSRLTKFEDTGLHIVTEEKPMQDKLKASVAKTVYEVWRDQGQPRTVSAHDVLTRYRQEIGEITAKVMNEELYLIEDQDAPFLRVHLPDTGEELDYVGLRDIYADRLLSIANEES
jgi:hypothetical protein